MIAPINASLLAVLCCQCRLGIRIQSSCVKQRRPGARLAPCRCRVFLARLIVKAGHNRIGRAAFGAGWRETTLAAARVRCAPREIAMIVNLRVFGLTAATIVGVMLVADWPALAADEITIGAPLPLTGALSPEGEKLKMGYELWLEELEKRGGISVGGVKQKVKLVYSDYQSQTPRAVQLAEKLISSDKVNFLFSPFGS